MHSILLHVEGLHLEPHVRSNQGPAAGSASVEGTWAPGVLGVDSVSSSEIAEYLRDIHGEWLHVLQANSRGAKLTPGCVNAATSRSAPQCSKNPARNSTLEQSD